MIEMSPRKKQISVTIDADVLEMLDKALKRTNARSRSELITILLKQTLPKYQEGAHWHMGVLSVTDVFRFFQELEERVKKLEQESEAS
jgi:metal-responsive CopG/Arc/MetJ family transcriptional regulator